jgi:hypothetical protein
MRDVRFVVDLRINNITLSGKIPRGPHADWHGASYESI